MNAREERRARAEERQRIAERRRAEGRDAPLRRRVRMARRKLGNALLDKFAPGTLRALARSWRVERIGVGLERGEPGVIALWHGRMLAPCPLHRGIRIAVLVSPSDDGKLVTGVLDRYGFSVVRGSASRGGSRALREMAGLLRAGTHVCITPDGPRGPRHAMNVGVAWLARASGAPIVPLGVACDRAWRLSSWDRFVIPKPRARVVLTYGEALRVAPDADDAELERVSALVRAQLLTAERAAFARLGVENDLEQ